MLETDDPLAIPLWINGHAYLTMAPAFLDVRNPVSGQVLRRTPLCGAGEAHKAAEAAQAALTVWSAQTVGVRAVLLSALGDALAGYAGHFAQLIVEETGKDADAAAAEVSAAVALLRDAPVGNVSGVVAIVSDDADPLLGALSRAVPVLLAGATLVIKPSPKAPSPLFALAELTARNGFPDGVFNILQGDEAAVEGLCTSSAISILLFAGNEALGARVRDIALRHDKAFEG
jgi:succinate-semialdehyde dehydrogenase/glutarate-semialdehyde dehydrogenase